jgi:hypothetical protein
MNTPYHAGFCHASLQWLNVRAAACAALVISTLAFLPSARAQLPIQLTFEAENMVHAGGLVSIVDDPNASGGKVVFLNSTAAGQTLTMTTPSLAAGTYQLQFRYKTNTSRGKNTVKIDGTQVGGTIDQYATTQAYLTADLGNVTFAANGSHTLVLTVTGKNSAATQFYITADCFILKLVSSPVGAPVFNPSGGVYSSSQLVTITTPTSGAFIRYTTDAVTLPSETVGTIYSGPVNIASTTTLQAIAYANGMTDSPVAIATYTINPGSLPIVLEAESIAFSGNGPIGIIDDPNASGGAYVLAETTGAGQALTWTTPSISAGIYQFQFRYKTGPDRGIVGVTIDGANLGPTIDQYSTTPAFLTANTGTLTFATNGTHTITLTVAGKNSASTQFFVTADSFTLTPGPVQVAAPVFSPPGGVYATTQSVTITSSTPGAVIRYTSDGSTPTITTGTIYPPAVIVSATTTLKAIAYLPGTGAFSPISTATYIIGEPPISFEAESLSPVGTGATVSTSNDANASGGVVEFLNSTAAGQKITFTTTNPNMPAGTFQVQFRYKTNTSRGQHTVTIDGIPVGGTIDQYATTQAYLTANLGSVTLAAGQHTIVLTVTGKNSAATQFYLTADKFTFTPQ